jgi:phage shock protein C
MKRIYRSTHDRKVAGICGGIGEIFNLDPTIVRLALVFLTVATGFVPFIAVYLVGWVIMPEDHEVPKEDDRT